MSDRTNRKVLEMVQSAVKLAQAVGTDIEYDRKPGEITIAAVNDFLKRHDELQNFLDLLEQTTNNVRVQ